MIHPTNDGGPAFPVPSYVNSDGETHQSSFKGMSLRDWFAAQALAGFCANSADPYPAQSARTLAVWAYGQADAMLEERKNK